MEEILRSAKSLMDTTDNRGVYNRARKKFLERAGLIKCSICGYNRGENDNRKYYGNTRIWTSGSRLRKPSWKLISKNKRQWNEKPKDYKEILKNSFHWGNYIDIKF
jgi:hypothetical protein